LIKSYSYAASLYMKNAATALWLSADGPRPTKAPQPRPSKTIQGQMGKDLTADAKLHLGQTIDLSA